MNIPDILLTVETALGECTISSKIPKAIYLVYDRLEINPQGLKGPFCEHIMNVSNKQIIYGFSAKEYRIISKNLKQLNHKKEKAKCQLHLQNMKPTKP